MKLKRYVMVVECSYMDMLSNRLTHKENYTTMAYNVTEAITNAKDHFRIKYSNVLVTCIYSEDLV